MARYFRERLKFCLREIKLSIDKRKMVSNGAVVTVGINTWPTVAAKRVKAKRHESQISSCGPAVDRTWPLVARLASLFNVM